MANDKCQMADGKGLMADDKGVVNAGGEGAEPMLELGQGRIVGCDPYRVMDDSTSDKFGILSHVGTDAADRPGQEACFRQSFTGEAKTPEKAPNEAKFESTQSSMNTGVETCGPGSLGRERSQNAQALVSGGRTVAST
jgi:hypothetical protein